jgi:cytochrome P450
MCEGTQLHLLLYLLSDTVDLLSTHFGAMYVYLRMLLSTRIVNVMSCSNYCPQVVYDVMDTWTEAMEAGANPPVDEYPILKLIPMRFAYWKRRAVAAGVVFDSQWGKARQIVEERRAKGDKRDCIMDSLLDEYNKKGWPMSQHAINNLVGEVVEGAADTTAAQILTLILAFAKYPQVQKRAREEIDKVCPPTRPPKFSDFKDIPYINQVVKEGMRWRPV